MNYKEVKTINPIYHFYGIDKLSLFICDNYHFKRLGLSLRDDNFLSSGSAKIIMPGHRYLITNIGTF